MAEDRRKCFVIGPIGDSQSEERINADWVLEYILKPVLEDPEFNYEVDRADKGDPGLITEQLIISIHEADLIVADLTGLNPNVFYELGIAHTLKKTIIHLMTVGKSLPFDIQDYRGVFYDRSTVPGIDQAKTQLRGQIEAVNRDGYEPSNPVSRALGQLNLLQTGDSRDQMIARLDRQYQEAHQLLSALTSKVAEHDRSIGNITVHPPTGLLSGLGTILTEPIGPSGKELASSLEQIKSELAVTRTRLDPTVGKVLQAAAAKTDDDETDDK